VALEVEAHRESGALVPLAGNPGVAFELKPGEKVTYRLQIEEETAGAWVRVKEQVAEHASPVVAVSGATECVTGDQLRTAARELAYPMRDPWFAGDISEMRGDLIVLVNTSEQPVTASLCYSAGNLYSVPDPTRGTSELTPVCSASFDVLIPPFGTRQFPVAREGNTHFSLKTKGPAIVLQMLRPLDTNVRIYAVDSTIKFGGEVPGK